MALKKTTAGTMALVLGAVRSSVAWSALPPATELRVAVFGAGISGSVAARRLAGAGAKVTVFEAGRGPGGRMSTRRAELPTGQHVSVGRRSRITPSHLAMARITSHHPTTSPHPTTTCEVRPWRHVLLAEKRCL